MKRPTKPAGKGALGPHLPVNKPVKAAGSGALGPWIVKEKGNG